MSSVPICLRIKLILWVWQISPWMQIFRLIFWNSSEGRHVQWSHIHTSFHFLFFKAKLIRPRPLYSMIILVSFPHHQTGQKVVNSDPMIRWLWSLFHHNNHNLPHKWKTVSFVILCASTSNIKPEKAYGEPKWKPLWGFSERELFALCFLHLICLLCCFVEKNMEGKQWNYSYHRWCALLLSTLENNLFYFLPLQQNEL